MRWVLEFLLGAAFWISFFYVMSEVIGVMPGDRPPVLPMGVYFAVATGRAMIYFQKTDRNLPRFALCHALAAAVGLFAGYNLFPPPPLPA